MGMACYWDIGSRNECSSHHCAPASCEDDLYLKYPKCLEDLHCPKGHTCLKDPILPCKNFCWPIKLPLPAGVDASAQYADADASSGDYAVADTAAPPTADVSAAHVVDAEQSPKPDVDAGSDATAQPAPLMDASAPAPAVDVVAAFSSAPTPRPATSCAAAGVPVGYAGAWLVAMVVCTAVLMRRPGRKVQRLVGS